MIIDMDIILQMKEKKDMIFIPIALGGIAPSQCYLALVFLGGQAGLAPCKQELLR